MSLEKPIEGVSEADLMALISSGGGNARIIECKRHLPGQTEAEQLEFVKDAASFANSFGGHILYGVKAESGIPAELAGLEKKSVAAAIPWLEQAAWAGLAPRIPGLRLKAIELANQNSVLLVHIPKTWAGPHMVVCQQANRFYARNPAGKYLLAVDELRAAFSLGESLRDRMRAFRQERVNAILNRGLSVRISEAPKTVLHILPVSSFRPGFRIALDQVMAGETQVARPMAARGLVSHYNYDGLITFSSMEKYAYSYVQVFRNGCLEAAESLLLEPKDGRKFFPSVAFEAEVIQCGERLLGLLHRLEIEPPYVVMLSFLGVRGYGMFVGSMRWQSNAHHVERDHLYLDEIIIDDAGRDFSRAIRPAFDQVWNSCGWARSLNYDADGNWRDHSRER